MKTTKTFKANRNNIIKRQSNFLKKFLFIGIIAASVSVLTGCQDQMTSIKPTNFEYQFRVTETTFQPMPAQLASTVTLDEESNKDTSKSNYNDAVPTIIGGMSRLQLEKMITSKNSNNNSWKETYDGKGVPLFKMSF